MTRSANDLFHDAVEDIIALSEQSANKNDAYQALDDDLAGQNGRYETQKLDQIANVVVGLYEFNLSTTDFSEKKCWDEALFMAFHASAGAIALKEPEVGNRLSDRDYRELEDIVEEYRQLSDEYKRWDARSGGRTHTTRGWGRGSSRGGRDFGRGRGVPDRRGSQRTNRSMFANDDVGGVSRNGTSNTSARSQAMVNRRQGELERERLKEQEARQRQHKVTRQSTTTTTNTSQVSDKQYITSYSQILQHPIHPSFKGIPKHDPSTQRIAAYLEDGYIHYEIWEIKDMDQEAHKRVISRFLSPARLGEYVDATKRVVSNDVRGYELPPSMVESQAVKNIIKERIESGELREGTKFSDLADSLKEDIITKVARKAAEQRELKLSQLRAKNIENGVDELSSTMVIMKPTLSNSSLVPTPQHAVSLLMQNYGTETMDDKNTIYHITYSNTQTIYRALDPLKREVTMNNLVGVRSKHATIEKLVASLRSNIPLPLFSLFNNKATEAINEAIHHILNIPQLTVDDFLSDIEDLSSWMVKNVEDGNLKNEQIDMVNRYVTSIVCRLVDPDKDTLKIHYPNNDEDSIDIMRSTCLFTNESGNVYWIPYLAGELGLRPGINRIDYSANTVVTTLFKKNGTSNRPTDYICTADGVLFRYIGIGEDNTLILKS